MALKKSVKQIIWISGITAGVALLVDIFGRRYIQKKFGIAKEEEVVVTPPPPQPPMPPAAPTAQGEEMVIQEIVGSELGR